MTISVSIRLYILKINWKYYGSLSGKELPKQQTKPSMIICVHEHLKMYHTK